MAKKWEKEKKEEKKKRRGKKERHTMDVSLKSNKTTKMTECNDIKMK